MILSDSILITTIYTHLSAVTHLNFIPRLVEPLIPSNWEEECGLPSLCDNGKLWSVVADSNSKEPACIVRVYGRGSGTGPYLVDSTVVTCIGSSHCSSDQ